MAIVKKIQVEVSGIVKHTDSVCTLILNPLSEAPNFSPGQFLHFAIDQYSPSSQWPESRVFSIQSAPTRKQHLIVTYAVKGRFTKRLYDEITVGDKVWIKMPYGSFTFPQNRFDKVFIAGGTGITPFLSYLTSEVDNKSLQNVHLFYGIRNDKLILFEDELDEYQNILKNFKVTYFIESNSNNILEYEHGPLNIDKILIKVKSVDESEYYLSGPPKMIGLFYNDLVKMNIAKERIFIDAWE